MEKHVQRTPLYSTHLREGGKLVEFAGWELPVRYSSVIAEHQAVRECAGLFDVSHMGELLVTGPEALQALQYLTCNDVARLKDGQAQYSAFLSFSGGVVDDIIIYREGENRFLICVNASNALKDFEWCKAHNKHDAVIENVSAQYAQIALQGPKSSQILSRICADGSVTDLPYFHFTRKLILGAEVVIARTGYTGEDGYELFVDPVLSNELWAALRESGQDVGLQPCGLGARDSLRLEACYPLHGHELSEDITALESGLGWIVKFKKPEFIGRSTLLAQKEKGLRRTLVGFFVEDAGIVREGSVLCDLEGNEIGSVTSGTKTPTLDRALGLALVNSRVSEIGSELVAKVRGRDLRVRLAKIPFYTSRK